MKLRIISIFLTVVGVGLTAASCDMRVSNPESFEYPCGPLGVVCSGSYPNASCCWQGDVCGSDEAFSTCPAGYCCWVGHYERHDRHHASGVFPHEPYVQVKGR